MTNSSQVVEMHKDVVEDIGDEYDVWDNDPAVQYNPELDDNFYENK